MTEHDTIQVLVVDIEEPMPGRRALSDVSNAVARVVPVSVAALKSGIQELTRQVNDLVMDLPQEGPARLSEISIDLGITGTGSVQWVVGVEGSVGSTTTLTFTIGGEGDRSVS